jgi:tripartite-type tricarboxylate transporter receptor subunit TctC
VKHLAALLVALAIGCASTPVAVAQDYPTKPIRAILPLSAGGLGDTVMRAIAQELYKSLGQTVVVENKPGASTMLGGQACATAPADGYTICMLAVDTLSYSPHLFKTVLYDPATAFQPITNVMFLTEVMSVNPSLNVDSMKALVELSKTRPNGLNYASPAHGVTLFMEKFKKDTGANFTMVPYRGGGDAVNAVLAGDVPVGFFGMGNSVANLTSGKLKPLAVDSPQRSPLLPDVPTFVEAGYTGVLNRAWFGMFAPASTPKPIVARLHAEITRIVSQPDFIQKFLVGLGLEPALNTPEEFAKFLAEDRVRAAELVKISGMQPQ